MPWCHLETSYGIKMSYGYSVHCSFLILMKKKNSERISFPDKGICYWPFDCLQTQYKKQYWNCPQSTVAHIVHIIIWYINIWPLYCASNFVFRMKFKKLKNMQITNGNKTFYCIHCFTKLNKIIFFSSDGKRRRESRLFGCDINEKNNKFECDGGNGSN